MILLILFINVFSYDYEKSFNAFYTSINSCIIAYSPTCVNNFRTENLDVFKDKIVPNVLSKINSQEKDYPISYRQIYDALYKRDLLVGLIYLNKKDDAKALNYLDSAINTIESVNVKPYYLNLRLAKELYDYYKKNNKTNGFSKLNSFFNKALKVCNTNLCIDKLNAIKSNIKSNKTADFSSFLAY